MKINAIMCDMCGSLHVEEDDWMYSFIVRGKGKDICRPCLQGILADFFAEEIKEDLPEKAEEEPEPEEPKAEKPVKEKEEKPEKEFDSGKAQALRDAGWSVSAIAKEMKTCKQTIYNNTHKPEEKSGKKPLEFTEA